VAANPSPSGNGHAAAVPAEPGTAFPTTPCPAPAEPVAPPANGNLTRRVRGAQMVDTGPDTPEATPASQRSADDVRAALSSFQQGKTLAATEVSHTNGKQ
jgi:hypothetical protein